jgi:ketosteroid isomerase-like protein
MARCTSAVLLLILMLGACRIEDRTPTGSRRDEEAVQALITGYARTFSNRDWKAVRALFWADASYAGPMIPVPGDAHQAVPIDLAINTIARRVDGLDPQRFDVRIVRADIRQDGDLAAVWMTTRRRIPAAGRVVEGDWVEHLVLRRIDGEWRILSVTARSARRRPA